MEGKCKKFWMVYGSGKGGPTVLHENLESAKTEAVRLANREKVAFYVLRCVGVAAPKAPPVEWRDVK